MGSPVLHNPNLVVPAKAGTHADAKQIFATFAWYRRRVGPRFRAGLSGEMIHLVTVHARPTGVSRCFLAVETQKGPGMRFVGSILGAVIKPLSRRTVAAAVARHAGDAYDKVFRTWDHLVALIFAQLSGADSLRAVAGLWNAHSHHHYHLGAGKLARSTLADANGRRPVAIFAEIFGVLSGLAERALRREGAAMLRLIDATPVPLDAIVGWAQWNGRTRGLKLHVVYDPGTDHPRRIAITPATVNDVEVGRAVPIEPGATYVFDKAYCHYGFWMRIAAAGATFVTRQKKNARYRAVARRPLRETAGDGFTVLADDEVKLVSKGNAKLPIPMRRIRIRRDNGGTLTLITNDLARTALEIAALYKMRWQIELLFRWIKQHLKLRKFLGRSENAIRLQLLAAMIAYLLLRIAARHSRLAIPALRFAELVSCCLFQRKTIARIDQPPDVNPSLPKPSQHPNQLSFCYA
jgi:putative transposase